MLYNVHPTVRLLRRSFAQAIAAACLSMQIMPRTLTVAASPPENPKNFGFPNANNAFAFELLHRLVADKPFSNQFLSPFSLESALLIALEGAREQTASQLRRALQLPGLNMAALRIEYKSITAGLTPPSKAGTAGIREQLGKLKKELNAANADATKLWESRKFAQANQIAEKASALANRFNQLSKQLEPFEIASANSLWVDKSYPLSNEYVRVIEPYYGTSAANVCDFKKNSEVERVRINQWVSTHTNERIPNIIAPGGISPDTRLVIANAIYFKGKWTEPFDKRLTKIAPFTRGDQTKSTVEMMFAPSLEVAMYAAFQSDGTLFKTPELIAEGDEKSQGYPGDDGYHALQLPYQGDRLSMLVILPRTTASLNKLVTSLNSKQFNTIRKALKNRPVDVRLPKFKMETNYDLIPNLKALGVRDAFSSQLANFSGLTQSLSPTDRLYITMVLHKAFVEVNEEGTEAAAATVVAMGPTSAVPSRPFIPEFTADHPFLFAIVDNTTDVILFVGKVDVVNG